MTIQEYKNKIIKKEIDENWYIIGIDLGTTNSVISYWNFNNKRPEPIDLSNGFSKIPMPSVAQYRNESGISEWIIGEEAYRSMKIYPETTILSVKRKMGTSEKVRIEAKEYLPEEISALILKEMINHIRMINPNMELVGVVVSVPYDFDDSAKKATIKACHLAGLTDSLICLVEEPKAAALAYNFRYELEQGEKIMVFDFGGGTLDITIFEVINKSQELIDLKVISEGGEAYHGGDNIDDALMDLLYQWVEEETGEVRSKLSKESKSELLQRARDTKERLSGVKKVRIPFTFCVPPFMKELTRNEFELLLEDFIKNTKKLVLKTLLEGYNGRIENYEISRILLEGGSSSMPWVREILIDIFNDEDKIYCSEKPALDISIGATYYSAIKMGILDYPELATIDRIVNFEVCIPHDIGFEIEQKGSKQFYKMISRGTPYKLAKKTQIFNLTGDSKADMTTLKIKIMERIHKSDKIEQCKLIGEVNIYGLPERPSGKTNLKVTLLVEEEGGLIKGTIEDLGYKEEYKASGFIVTFIPERNENVMIDINKLKKRSV